MISMKRISLIGSAFRAAARPGPSTRVLSLRSFRLALLAAMVLAGLAFWSTAADGQEAEEPVWSADMTVVEYNSVSIGAASADLFSNVGGSGNLQIKSLWSYIPGRDLRLAFQEGVPDAPDYTLQVGGLSLEFPADSSGESNFQWNDVDVQWEDGQVIHARIVPTAEIDAPQANTPATGVPTVSGTAQVGETLTADTSSVADADGLTNVSYAYRWIRTDGGADADIAGATDSAYTLTDDDQGKTIKLRVTFNDDQGNSETLTSAVTADVGKKPQFLVSNLGAGLDGAGGIQRPLNAARSGFAQAFTTGAKTGGYAPGSVGIQVSHFFDASTVGDHLRVTINGVASEGEPGDARCTLTNPSSFSTPGVSAFEAPTGAGACPQLAAETTYFVVIEWVNPSGTDAFALIPQTYPTSESAATEEDPGGAEGWSIADQAHYLTVGSDARTWTAYDETASFKIVVKEADVTAARANSPATGLPTITGTAQAGETLTADTSAIADDDGLEDAAFSYQWVANDGTADTDIEGSTDATYTLGADDEGRTIRVRVSFTDDAGNEETLTSTPTATVVARPNSPATGVPAISGAAQVGETLTAVTSVITDADGLTNAVFSYQWVANDGSADTDIQDSTESTYMPSADVVGKAIRVRVSFTDDADNEESLTSAATGEVEARPNSAASGTLTISGTAQVGETLTADTSGIADADGLDAAAFSYQWVADDTDIDEARNSTYTLVSADEGKTIKVKVSFTDDADHEETLTSAGKTVEASASHDRPHDLQATAVEGAITVTWQDPDTHPSHDLYEILRRRPELGEAKLLVYAEYVSITDRTFTDSDVEPGVLYEYAVKAVQDYLGYLGPASDPVAVRMPTGESGETPKVNSPATGQPTVSGTAQVGETLAAETSGISDADGMTSATFTYQWLADDANIQDATDSTYTLADRDESKAIKVKVSFTDDEGNEETLTSAATHAVAGPPSEPLTVNLENTPDTHDGGTPITFELRFSEEFDLSYKTLRDHAFTVVGGSVKKAQRMDKSSNIRWLITVQPDADGDVSITLPATEDCGDSGAICTEDGRMLSNRLELTVSGPGQ